MIIIICTLFLPNLPLSPRPWLFKRWIALPTGYITIQQIMQLSPTILIRWIVIYPADCAIQLLNNIWWILNIWAWLSRNEASCLEIYRVQLQIWLQWLSFLHNLHYTAFWWSKFHVSHCKCFIYASQKANLKKVEFGTLKHI